MQNTAIQLFIDSFGCKPTVVSRAPGRVEVLGNHTDYNEGFVLSAAIDNDIVVAMGPSDDASFSCISTLAPTIRSVPADQNSAHKDWTDYPLGVWTILSRAGFPVKPVKMAVAGNIPAGAGLSSSAALEVATGLCLNSLFNLDIEKTELAKVCQRAENDFVGAHVGLLDQFTSLLGEAGHLLFTDFRSLEYKTVPLPAEDLLLAITTSGVSHSLADSAYNDRRKECEMAAEYFQSVDPSVRTLRDVSMEQLMAHQENLPPIPFKRARHIVGENERVLQAIKDLERGALEDFGRALFRSHESSKLNFNNSCMELDTLVTIARGIEGVYGSRLTGGGFGGATLTFLHRERKKVFQSEILTIFEKETGKKTAIHYATIADGARVL